MALLSLRKPSDHGEDFESLLENHLDGMYRLALRYTRDPAMAEDLVHDAAVRALRFRDRFELGTNFRAWIYTILTHTFIHRYRRQKREREVLDGVSRLDVQRNLRSESTASWTDAPESAYFDRLLSDDVVKALDALPEDYRTVVTLCDLEGLSYKEIADVMGCPVGTVMSRLYRGRRQLERQLHALAVERGIIKGTPDGVETAESGGEEAILDISVFRRRRDG